MICTSETQVHTRMQTPIVSSPGHNAGRCGPTQIAEHKTPSTWAPLPVIFLAGARIHAMDSLGVPPQEGERWWHW